MSGGGASPRWCWSAWVSSCAITQRMWASADPFQLSIAERNAPTRSEFTNILVSPLTYTASADWMVARKDASSGTWAPSPRDTLSAAARMCAVSSMTTGGDLDKTAAGRGLHLGGQRHRHGLQAWFSETGGVGQGHKE